MSCTMSPFLEYIHIWCTSKCRVSHTTNTNILSIFILWIKCDLISLSHIIEFQHTPPPSFNRKSIIFASFCMGNFSDPLLPKNCCIVVKFGKSRMGVYHVEVYILYPATYAVNNEVPLPTEYWSGCIQTPAGVCCYRRGLKYPPMPASAEEIKLLHNRM